MRTQLVSVWLRRLYSVFPLLDETLSFLFVFFSLMDGYSSPPQNCSPPHFRIFFSKLARKTLIPCPPLSDMKKLVPLCLIVQSCLSKIHGVTLTLLFPGPVPWVGFPRVDRLPLADVSFSAPPPIEPPHTPTGSFPLVLADTGVGFPPSPPPALPYVFPLVVTAFLHNVF